jgi:hypothetical protein
VVGLAVVVGFGVLGGGGGASGPGATSPAPSDGVAALGVAAPAAIGPTTQPPDGGASAPLRSERDIITLEAPAHANASIATRAIVVRGFLQAGTARVQVLLQSRTAGAVAIDMAEARSQPHGGVGGSRLAFEAVLDLPEPRPFGPAVLQLVAYDRVGRARDMLLVPIQIGASTADSPLLTEMRTTTGEDGMMGGIVFDRSFTGEGDRD